MENTQPTSNEQSKPRKPYSKPRIAEVVLTPEASVLCFCRSTPEASCSYGAGVNRPGHVEKTPKKGLKTTVIGSSPLSPMDRSTRSENPKLESN